MRASRIAVLGVTALTACGHSYSPRVPHSAQSPSTRLSVTLLATAPPQLMYPPVGALLVEGPYKAEPSTSLSMPRLAAASSAPCTAGAPATALVVRNDAGTLGAIFRRDAVDQLGLLAKEPTMLDVAVREGEGGEPFCLRVPIVTDPAKPEWSEKHVLSLGYGFGLFVPMHRIYTVAASPTFALRMGPWIGPVRVRTELGVGGAWGQSTNPNLVGYAYRGGLLVDTLLLHVGRYGLGLAAGYDATAVVFGQSIQALSDQGSGYRGLLHGPRLGLAFTLLPEPPPGPAFEARPNSHSASIEIYLAAESSSDRDKPAGAIWTTLAFDAGL